MHEVKLCNEKKTHIFISSLRVDPNKPDCDLVIDLYTIIIIIIIIIKNLYCTDVCIQNITPRLVKRIGKNMHGKPQLLLVYLRTENDRCDILQDAKLVRKSKNEYARNNVYINPDRTRMESEEFKKHRTSHRQSTSHDISAPQAITVNPNLTTVKTIASPPS